MAKTIRDKFDLFTLAIKGKLIGTGIVMEDDNAYEVKDFYCDYATSEIHIEFTDSSSGSFNLMDKFIVEVEESYKSIPSKKKVKNKKKNKKNK